LQSYIRNEHQTDTYFEIHLHEQQQYKETVVSVISLD